MVRDTGKITHMFSDLLLEIVQNVQQQVPDSLKAFSPDSISGDIQYSISDI